MHLQRGSRICGKLGSRQHYYVGVAVAIAIPLPAAGEHVVAVLQQTANKCRRRASACCSGCS